MPTKGVSRAGSSSLFHRTMRHFYRFSVHHSGPVRVFCLLGLLLCVTPAKQARSQAILDTVLTWSGYLSESLASVTVYETLPDSKKRGVVVIREVAENSGRSAVADARFLAEKISSILDKSAADLYWIFHWGSFSHKGAEQSSKEILLKASFRLNNGKVSPPQWRVITRDTMLKYTDRQFR